MAFLSFNYLANGPLIKLRLQKIVQRFLFDQPFEFTTIIRVAKMRLTTSQ